MPTLTLEGRGRSMYCRAKERHTQIASSRKAELSKLIGLPVSFHQTPLQTSLSLQVQFHLNGLHFVIRDDIEEAPTCSLRPSLLRSPANRPILTKGWKRSTEANGIHLRRLGVVQIW